MKNGVAITGLGLYQENLNGMDGLKAFLNGKEEEYRKPLFFKNRKIKKMLSRSEKFFCHAAIEAVNMSNIMECPVEENKRGIFLGTTKESSSREELLEVLRSIYTDKINAKFFPKAVSDNMSPLFVVKSLPNACLHYAAEEFDIRGNNTLFTTNGVASSQALIAAASSIKRGDSTWALAGGFDSHKDEGEYYNFAQYGLMPNATDSDDKSNELGEGAGVLLLEAYEHANKRKAHIWGEILGYSETFLDVVGNSKENIKKVENAVKECVRSAGLDFKDIDLVSLDGTLEPNYKAIETYILKKFFPNIETVNYKSVLGNMVAASTVIETILAIISGCMKSEKKHDTILKISYGFGGEISIILLRRNNI